MESVFFIVFLIVIVIVLIRKSLNSQSSSGGVNAHFDALVQEIIELKKEIKSLKYNIQDSTKELSDKMNRMQEMRWQDGPRSAPESAPPEEVVLPEPPVVMPELQYKEEITIIIPAEPAVIVYEAGIPEAAAVGDYEAATTENNEPASATPEVGAPPPPAPAWVDEESWMDRWLRNNPDLEKFIGENLINKVGIAILVLGIAFFVKYAIDQNWISEVGRVSIGLGCGAILVGLAHYLRNSYRSFSSVLAGGGIAVFYFTIAFGFHQYHLMPQAAAFVIMVVITAFAIALSVLYDRLELAVIATIGGFLAPFMVSTGDGNYVVLFIYLIVLNIGVLSLAYFRRWTAINIIALFFTEIIYGGWLSTVLGNPAKHISYPLAMLFASVFYFIFLCMNMIHQVSNKQHFRPFDFFILLLISSTYFGAGMLLLHEWNGGAYQGLFTLAMGLINLGLAYYVYKKGQADRNLLFLLIGMTLTFITLTIPIQLHGHAITLFWSAEFVLLYWLSEYSGIKLFKYSSLFVCALAMASLFLDWGIAGQQHSQGLLVIYGDLQGIVTNVVAVAAFAVWYFLLKKNGGGDIGGVPNVRIARVSLLVAIALLYLTCIFGVNLYYVNSSGYAVPNIYHRLITEVFALVLMIIAVRRQITNNYWLQFAALAVCFLFLITSSAYIADVQNYVLHGSADWLLMVIHWVDTVLLGVIFMRTIQGIRRSQAALADSIQVLSIILTLMVIIFFSVELQHIYIIAGYRNDNIPLLSAQYNKAGLTVIWAICSFALMWLGMKHSQKTMRILSLVLFSLVLLKLFIFDISRISEGGKILAFILLGVLLLTVSFMYQKLKKIIIDDKKE